MGRRILRRQPIELGFMNQQDISCPFVWSPCGEEENKGTAEDSKHGQDTTIIDGRSYELLLWIVGPYLG